jgi:hypothetical protein
MRRNIALLAVLSIALAALLLARIFTPGDTAQGTGASIFGDGSDGARVYSVDATDNPKDSAASGTVGMTTLIAPSANALDWPGEIILIHQTRRDGGGYSYWEINRVQSYTLGNIITVTPLQNTYYNDPSSGGKDRAQVLIVPQYSSLTVNSGVTVTAKAWDGTTGGILAALVSGTATINGTIGGSARGFLGGQSVSAPNVMGYHGEGMAGPSFQKTWGGPGPAGNAGQASQFGGHSGSGGGNGTLGGAAIAGLDQPGENGGGTAGSATADNGSFGGGGASGYAGNEGSSGVGGRGGGFVLLAASNLSLDGTISADGQNGAAQSGSTSSTTAAGGGGAGGVVVLRTGSATLGSSLVSARGGNGGTTGLGGHGGVGGLGSGSNAAGGNGDYDGGGGGGGAGRIRLEYCGTPPSGGQAEPPATLQQISCKTPPAELYITKLSQIAPPKSCHSVRNGSQTPIFQVCDNDWLGTPVPNAVCVPDAICNDEDSAQGEFKVSVSPGSYNVVESVAPPNHTLNATPQPCDASSGACSVEVVDAPVVRPWHPWDIVGGPGGVPDGIVSVADILAVVQHYQQNKPFTPTPTP